MGGKSCTEFHAASPLGITNDVALPTIVKYLVKSKVDALPDSVSSIYDSISMSENF